MIQGFFFDLDGTLVDTHQANYEAYSQAIKDIAGVDVTYEAFKRTVGHQARTFLPWFVPDGDDAMYQEITAKKAVYYKTLVHLSVLNVRLVNFIKDLQPDHTMALVTTAKKQNAIAVLQHHKLEGIFDIMVTAEDVGQPKPSPEGYKLALAKAGLEPAEALAFEDSEVGMQAAQAAGIAVIRINKFML